MIRNEKIRETKSVAIEDDIGVMKYFISEVVTEPDGIIFDADFNLLFGRANLLYSDAGGKELTRQALDKVKALMIVTVVALMNVDDVAGDERSELVPFFTALLKDPYFYFSRQNSGSAMQTYSMQAFAQMLFGCYVDDVQSDMEPCRLAMKNKLSFVNTFMKKGKNAIGDVGARTLQYMCITMLFRIVSSAFVEYYDTLLEVITVDVDDYAKKYPGQVHAWSTVLPYYNGVLRGIVKFDRSEQRLMNAFREEYGYDLYVKLLLLSTSTTKGTVVFSTDLGEKSKKTTDPGERSKKTTDPGEKKNKTIDSGDSRKKRKGEFSGNVHPELVEQRICSVEHDAQVRLLELEALQKRVAGLEEREEQRVKQIADQEATLVLIQAMLKGNTKEDLQVPNQKIPKNSTVSKAAPVVRKSRLLNPMSGIDDAEDTKKARKLPPISTMNYLATSEKATEQVDVITVAKKPVGQLKKHCETSDEDEDDNSELSSVK